MARQRNLAADLLEGSWALASRLPVVVLALASAPLFGLADAIHSDPPEGSTRLKHAGGYSGPTWRQTPAEKRRRAALSGY